MATLVIKDGQSTASEILRQLGGRRFVAMTGAKNFLFSDITATCPNIWLRMDLTTNKSGANRLKITLKDDDTYTMYFYRQTIKTKGGIDCVVSKEQKFEGVYCDQLQEIFTNVTGLYTSLI